MSKTKEINYLNINMLANGFKTSHTDFFESKEYKDLAAEMIRYFPNYHNDLKLKKLSK